MRYRNARLGQQLLELGAAVFDRLDLVVQKVNLPATFELAQHRLADHAIAFGAYKSLDRQAALGGGGDDREVAQAFKCHAHGARNGRGRQREHIDFGAHGLHGLLVAHAKTVFLVNDEQAQVLEMRAWAEQLVRAHHDVDGAVGHAFEGGSDFFAGAKAADLGHLHRPFAKAVHQRLEMLLSQERGRCQHRHLFAARDGHKGGAQRDLGFAKAHIATNQPVHGARADHVLNYRVDGGALVGGFFKTKVVGKSLVILRRVAEGVALAQRAARIDVQQLGGSVAHLLGRFALGFFPLAAAQAVQRRFFGADTGVAADQL